MNARFECNDIVIFIYSLYPLDPNGKIFDTKGNTFSFRWFCNRIKRVMTVYDCIYFKKIAEIFSTALSAQSAQRNTRFILVFIVLGIYPFANTCSAAKASERFDYSHSGACFILQWLLLNLSTCKKKKKCGHAIWNRSAFRIFAHTQNKLKNSFSSKNGLFHYLYY